MTFSLLFGFHLALQVSDILLPHHSLPNSFCHGPRFHESPTDLIFCKANRIPFVSQDIDLDSWADSLAKSSRKLGILVQQNGKSPSIHMGGHRNS
jgi:hypothetical protein